MQLRRLSATEIIQTIRSAIPTARCSRHYTAPAEQGNCAGAAHFGAHREIPRRRALAEVGQAKPARAQLVECGP